MLGRVSAPTPGSQSLFVGTVRAERGTREVTALEYEAFADLAEREMVAICREAGERFGARCAIAHRTGRVGVGEPAVVAVAAGATTEAAIDACEWAVDALKARVPIWKMQRYADGSSEWVQGA